MQFVKSFLGGKIEAGGVPVVGFTEEELKATVPKTNNNAKKLLVIEARNDHQFTPLFQGITIAGEEIQVYQAGWDAISLASYYTSNAPLPVATYVDVVIGSKRVTFKPDFVLVRNEVKEPQPNRRFQNILFGLMYGGIPAVNSLHSIYCFLERPVVFAELLKIRQIHGFDKFPLISQTYHSSHRAMDFGPDFPAVVKVGHAHAGMGKMIINDHHQYADFSTVLALTDNYCTGEPFLEGEYDLRIQKIGSHYRVYRRFSVSGNWKTNTGSSVMEEIEITPQYKFWADEASKIFGGLDILAVDAIHTTDGKEYILEVNGGSIGLGPDRELEDMGYIRDLVVERLRYYYE